MPDPLSDCAGLGIEPTYLQGREPLQANSFFFFFLVFCLFRAAPAAYGCSQVRGLIRAVSPVDARAIAMPDPGCICDLHHSSPTEQGQGSNPQPHGS